MSDTSVSKRRVGVGFPAVRSLTVETAVHLCMGESHAVTVTSRISDKFQVRSNGGAVRVIVCMEEQIEGVSSSGFKYQSRSDFKNYQFEGGEPATKIGDAFLDRTGQIYRRITPDSQEVRPGSVSKGIPRGGHLAVPLHCRPVY